jgi:predicted ATPase
MAHAGKTCETAIPFREEPAMTEGSNFFAVYAEYGYTVIEIPKLPVAERATFVVQHADAALGQA